jgi:hypothetical protein
VTTIKNSDADDSVQFLAAITKNGLVFHQMTRDYVERWDFINFLKKMLMRTGTNVVVVMNNAGFHIAKDV